MFNYYLSHGLVEEKKEIKIQQSNSLEVRQELRTLLIVPNSDKSSYWESFQELPSSFSKHINDLVTLS